jgi:hypothetical protein
MEMNLNKHLFEQIEVIPEETSGELLDFIGFLKLKVIQRKSETAIASESSLAKDWLSPEEDQAWQGL